MVYFGKVQDGVVVVQGSPALPEGATVRIEPLESSDVDALKSLKERLLCLAGSIGDLPPDFAENHDKYLHGATWQ